MRKSDGSSFAELFQSLRGVLQKHAATLVVSEDTPTKYCLEAPIGPATLQAWGRESAERTNSRRLGRGGQVVRQLSPDGHRGAVGGRQE